MTLALLIVAMGPGCTSRATSPVEPDEHRAGERQATAAPWPPLAGSPSLRPTARVTRGSESWRASAHPRDDIALLQRLRGTLVPREATPDEGDDRAPWGDLLTTAREAVRAKASARCAGVVLELVDISRSYASAHLLEPRSRIVLRVENTTATTLGMPGPERLTIVTSSGTAFVPRSSPEPLLWFQPIDVAASTEVKLTVVIAAELTKRDVSAVVVRGAHAAGSGCAIGTATGPASG